MDKNIIILLAVSVLIIVIGVQLLSSNPSQVITLCLGAVLFSLVFFSRGILIFLTALTIMIAATTFTAVKTISMQLRWVFFILCALHVFGDIFLGRTVRKIQNFDFLAIIFVVYSFLSASYSPFPTLTIERSTTILLLYICVFWIIWKYAYSEGPEKVVNLVLQIIAIIIAASYLKVFMNPLGAFRLGRFMGIFGNPNTIGMICAILLPLSLWRFLETKRHTALLLFILMSGALFLSASRGSINAAVISMGYFIYVRSKSYRPLVFFSSMSFILIFAWIVENLIKHFFVSYLRVETIPTAAGRIGFWSIGLGLISKRPFFGYGFGVEEKLFSLNQIMGFEKAELHFHNSYVGMALQLGVFGFIIFFVPLFVLLFKEIFSEKSKDFPLLRYALQASVIAGLACCLFESWIYSVGNSQTLPFWIMVMLLVFYRHQDKEKAAVLEGT